MKMKRVKAMVMAGIMAAALCAGSTAVFADAPAAGIGDLDITKRLNIAEGITVPDVTFTFDIAKVTQDAPEVSDKIVTYSDEDGVTDGDVEKTVQDIFTGVTFPHAGVFQYTVTETAGDTEVDGGTIFYDSSAYTVYVYVENGEKGPEINQITVQGTSGKMTELAFENTYRKTTDLEVTKNTVGSLADKTKEFSFRITFTKASTCEEELFTSGDETYEYGKEYTFTLADGESQVFSNLPAGTRYVVTEAGAEDGYTPSVSVVENGAATVNKKASDEKSDLASAETGETNLAGEGENSVTFTNTYNDVPITGVIMNNLPFILLIVAAAGGFTVYVISRRHRMAK